MKPRLTYLALVGVFAAAFALSGCGRKGPLDPPPGEGAAATSSKSSRSARSSPTLNPFEKEQKTASPAFDADGKPIANPNAPKKRLPMDWLLD